MSRCFSFNFTGKAWSLQWKKIWRKSCIVFGGEQKQGLLGELNIIKLHTILWMYYCILYNHLFLPFSQGKQNQFPCWARLGRQILIHEAVGRAPWGIYHHSGSFILRREKYKPFVWSWRLNFFKNIMFHETNEKITEWHKFIICNYSLTKISSNLSLIL